MSSPTRDKSLLVRVSADEKARIEANAKRAGLTASEYVRARSLEGDSEQIAAEAQSFALMQERRKTYRQTVSALEKAAAVAVAEARRALGGEE